MAGPPADTPSSAAPVPGRCPSIDIFRGVVIAAMLLVNSIRSREFAPETFRHADWRVPPLHATFADMVAPWFVLAVGLSLPFSMRSGRGRGKPLAGKLLSAGRRMALLFIIGGVIEVARHIGFAPITWRTLISTDVLPQIGVAYFVTVILYHGPAWSRPAFIAAVFISKEILLAHWPYPGVGHPMWTPEQNMQDYLRAQFPLLKGLHGALVAASIACIGTYLGDQLRRLEHWHRDAVILISAGAAMTLIAWIWSYELPCSKYYHTPTWALLAAGTGSMMLGVIRALSAVRVGSWLRMFEPLGRNPIAVYIIAELLWPVLDPFPEFQRQHPERTYPWDALEHSLGLLVGGALAPWVQVGLYLAGFWLLAWALHRKKVVLRL